jgi:signal peptidase I
MKRTELSINQTDFISLAEEITGKGKSFTFRAMGGSMSPFIRDGDTILITPIQGKLRTGDIVLIKAEDGKVLLHRVVRKDKAGLITRGDSNMEIDGTFPESQIVGRVTKITGQGFNFHLKNPFRYMIARRVFYTPRLSRIPVLRSILKTIAQILG